MVEQTPTSVEQTKFSLLYFVEQNQTMVVEQNHTIPVEQTNVTRVQSRPIQMRIYHSNERCRISAILRHRGKLF